MADDLRVNSWLVIPAGELRERFSRSSGPGGQSVNTTDSRVELSFDVARSTVLPERERGRALARLRARLAALLREATAPPPPPRVPTKPTRGSRERRLEGKRRRAQTKRNRRYETGGD